MEYEVMKIIYLVHQFYPEFQAGTEKFIFNCAYMSQLNGNKVKVITYSFLEDSKFSGKLNDILYREYSYEGIPVFALKQKIQPIDLNYSLDGSIYYDFAKKILIKESPDIIHVGHSMRVHPFIMAARDLNIPYIITLTDFFLICPKVILAPNQYSLCSGPNKGNECFKLCNEFNKNYIIDRLQQGENILNFASSIFSPSKFLANIFNNEYKHLQIKIIGHGIDYKQIITNNREYSCGSKLTFGYAGTLIFHKGVHLLINAFNQISNSNLELKIYGSGEKKYVSELKALSKNDDRILFMGTFKPEMLGGVYKLIDVMVIPSMCYETYQFVLHEALASNIPVICSDLGDLTKKINDGFNGLKFIPGDTNDLSLKINMMANEPELMNRMKKNIKKKNIVPSIEQEAYQYNKIYNYICN